MMTGFVRGSAFNIFFWKWQKSSSNHCYALCCWAKRCRSKRWKMSWLSGLCTEKQDVFDGWFSVKRFVSQNTELEGMHDNWFMECLLRLTENTVATSGGITGNYNQAVSHHWYERSLHKFPRLTAKTLRIQRIIHNKQSVLKKIINMTICVSILYINVF